MYYSAQSPPAHRLPTYHERRDTIVIDSLGYEPATPNPPECEETYRPVALEWRHVDGPFGTGGPKILAANGWRGNRTYQLTWPGAVGSAFSIAVNGIHIPVTFVSAHDAKLFAQAIEDANTED